MTTVYLSASSTSGMRPSSTPTPYTFRPPPGSSGGEMDNDSDESEDDMSDDEGEFNNANGNDGHEELHSAIGRLPFTTDFTAGSSLTISTTSKPASSSRSTSTITTLTMSSVSETSSTTVSSLVRASNTSSAFDASNIDSIPQNEADPAIESRLMSSPLGTAGIILVSIFGFVALISTFYLFFRLKKRRRNEGARQHGSRRPDTSNSFTSLEKGPEPVWPFATQETGIIFGRRSNTFNQDSALPRRRGRFSFLHRRWYSTGTEAVETRIPTSPLCSRWYSSSSEGTDMESPPASTPLPSPFARWGATFLGLGRGLGLGLGLRSQLSTPRSNSTSTVALNASYTNGRVSQGIARSPDVQRNISQRSAATINSESGEGHARAYAHHNVCAPRSVARSTMSSVSSKWLRRPHRGDQRSVPSTPSASSISETSEAYGGMATSRRTTLRSDYTLSRDRRRSKESLPPRLPLPVAVSPVAMSSRVSV